MSQPTAPPPPPEEPPSRLTNLLRRAKKNLNNETAKVVATLSEALDSAEAKLAKRASSEDGEDEASPLVELLESLTDGPQRRKRMRAIARERSSEPVRVNENSNGGGTARPEETNPEPVTESAAHQAPLQLQDGTQDQAQGRSTAHDAQTSDIAPTRRGPHRDPFQDISPTPSSHEPRTRPLPPADPLLDSYAPHSSAASTTANPTEHGPRAGGIRWYHILVTVTTLMGVWKFLATKQGQSVIPNVLDLTIGTIVALVLFWLNVYCDSPRLAWLFKNDPWEDTKRVFGWVARIKPRRRRTEILFDVPHIDVELGAVATGTSVR